MVAGGVTGGADLADLVHLADGLTLADQDAGHEIMARAWLECVTKAGFIEE